MIRGVLALAAGLLGGAACSAPSSAPAPAHAIAAAPAWQVRGAGGREPIELGTSDPALVDATRCAGCHQAITAEWQTSRHALAWTNDLFQREYQTQEKPWCVNCHAPTAPQQAELAAGGHVLADQGVSCATCHVRAGRLVAARRSAGSPHDTVVDPSFGSPAFCADCHEFTFPVLSPEGKAVAMTPHPMQSTVSSFTRGPHGRAPRGCLTCHDSDHGHGFPGGHDPGMVDTALDVGWCRRGASLEVAVTNVGAGHAVPTGDIHRHFLLKVWRSSAPAGLWEGFFGRRFDDAGDGGKRTIWDSSLAPGQTRRFAIEVAALAGEGGEADPAEPINLELVYVFIERELPRADRAPREPGTATVVRWRSPLPEVPACDRDPA
ncbi:MAG TPA: multiheme c-type cytochrome [Kofleriaceae bacterium]|nr:multiheme c-type cytochrome [Kofleriaceae bacterium]